MSWTSFGVPVIAYLDGEASPALAARIARDPAALAVARSYATVQMALRRRLYRCTCLSPHALGEYELRLLDSATWVRVAAHVAACPRCLAEVEMLRRFLAIPEPFPISIAARVRRIVATLLPPPLPVPGAVLRGASDPARRRYRARDVTITLDCGAPMRRGRTSIVGLLWREATGADGLADSSVLLDGGGATRTTAVDDLGNFAFDDIIPGTYRLEVMLGNDCIIIEGLAIG